MVRKGVRKMPPPKPVNDPKNPVKRAHIKTSNVKIKIVILWNVDDFFDEVDRVASTKVYFWMFYHSLRYVKIVLILF